jgi:hypothetical protein
MAELTALLTPDGLRLLDAQASIQTTTDAAAAV